MTIKVRSSAGNSDINDATPDIDSPATILVDDLLVILWMINSDSAQTVTPSVNWSENDTVTDSIDTRYMVFSKRADQSDVDNAGSASYYIFTGMNGSHDILYGIFSIYDDAGSLVSYKSSSLAGNAESGANTSNDAPTQTIAEDKSLALCAWAAVNGANLFNISVGESFSAGSNSAIYQDAWTAKGMSNASWAVASTEFAIADSPTGVLTLSHQALGSDSEQFSVSIIFDASASTSTGYNSIGRGIMRGVGRGIG